MMSAIVEALRRRREDREATKEDRSLSINAAAPAPHVAACFPRGAAAPLPAGSNHGGTARMLAPTSPHSPRFPSCTSRRRAPRCHPLFPRADAAEAGAVAKIATYFGWRRVVPVYQDDDGGAAFVPLLIDALTASPPARAEAYYRAASATLTSQNVRRGGARSVSEQASGIGLGTRTDCVCVCVALQLALSRQ
ncbi:unnamed protein product [Urochloa humidicola]